MRKLFPIIAVMLMVMLVLAGCASQASAPSASTAAPAAATSVVSTSAASTTASAAAPTKPAAASTTAAATSPAVNGAGKEVTVFAAASLTDSFNQMVEGFAQKSGGAKVVFSFAGSNALRAQIEQGAKADVFASANTTEMDALVKGGLISGQSQTFAKNKLVIIVPKANPGKVEKPQDLAKSGLKIVAAGQSVPVGSYFLQILDKMNADASYGAGFKDRVTKNFISQETDVKQVVAKIQLGEGDAGVVYLTDITAKAAPDLTVIDIPDAFNVVAQYPIAVVKNAPQSALAQAFIDYVLSPDGQQILKKNNFVPVK
jgi:molybdate transport system substrate-binding protein